MTLQEQIPLWENLTLAYANASRGKRGRGSTAAFELYLADNLLQLQYELREKTYRPGAYTSFYIHDPKKRLISAAPFRDRVVHHALCNLTTPIFERHFIFDSYANRVGKGTHRALDRAQYYARCFQYVLQCDIRQYFPSIDHALFLSALARLLQDDSASWLIQHILESGVGILSEEYEMVYFAGDDLFAVNRPRGLPIGNLTSQLWANCFVNTLDHDIKRQLKCKGFVRYVDDFLLFSDSKTQLWEWRAAIIEKLASLRLTLHEGSSTPYPVKAGIPFLGFILFPDHRRLKRRKGIAFQRKLGRFVRQGNDEKIQVSLRGWFNHVCHADTFGLRQSLLKKAGLLANE